MGKQDLRLGRKQIEELRKVARKYYSFKMVVIIEVGLNTGMKISEMLPLRWDDITNEDGSIRDSITIIQNNIHQNKRTVFFSTKIKNFFAELRKMKPEDIYVFQATRLVKPMDKCVVHFSMRSMSLEIGLRQTISSSAMRNTLIHYLAPKEHKDLVRIILTYSDESNFHPAIRKSIREICNKIDV